MLQERFRDLLEIMATFLEHQGYKQSRKKGEFHRPVSGKIIKLRMVLSSRMRGGRVGAACIVGTMGVSASLRPRSSFRNNNLMHLLGRAYI